MIIHLRSKNVEGLTQKVLKECPQPGSTTAMSTIQRKDSKEDDNKGHPKEEDDQGKWRNDERCLTFLIIIAALTALAVHSQAWSFSPLEMATATATSTLSTIRNFTDTTTMLSRSSSNIPPSAADLHDDDTITEKSIALPSADPHVFDVMVGKAGQVMERKADILMKFDPGNALIKYTTLESYPFAIADFDGTAEFWMNDDLPACSSINHVHGGNELGHNHVTELQEWYSTWKGSQCPNKSQQSKILKFAFMCMFPQKSHYVKDIPVRRLSSVLRERGVVKIKKLQISSQGGSDFAILKEVLENYGDYVSIEEIELECQYYGTGTRPLFYASNDCQQIKNYMQMKYPNKAVTLHEEINNCAIMEYKLRFVINNSNS